MKKILVPYDSSDFSKLAFDKALELASQLGTTLHVLRVIGPKVNVSGMSYSRAQEALDEQEEEVKQELEELKKDAEKKNISLRYHILHDPSASSGITRFADSEKIDLIIIGSHGRTGLRSVLGSVATGVIKNVQCPIMIVKKQKE